MFGLTTLTEDQARTINGGRSKGSSTTMKVRGSRGPKVMTHGGNLTISAPSGGLVVSSPDGGVQIGFGDDLSITSPGG
jgi:hypothetical protein